MRLSIGTRMRQTHDREMTVPATDDRPIPRTRDDSDKLFTQVCLCHQADIVGRFA